MSPALRLQRLEGLATLLEASAGSEKTLEPGQLLDALLVGTPAMAAVAYRAGNTLVQTAERRLDTPSAARPKQLSEELEALALRALEYGPGRLARTTDLGESGQLVEVLALGARAAVAVPIVVDGVRGAVVVALLASTTQLDEEALDFVEAAVRIAALSWRGDARGEPTLGVNLRESRRLADFSMATRSVARELKAPLEALLVQHGELARIAEQLALVAPPGDAALGGGLAELADVVAELRGATESLRSKLVQLSEIGEHEALEPVDLSEICRRSLTLMGPYLEHLDVELVTELDRNCLALGRAHQLEQVVLGLVLNAVDAVRTSAPARLRVRVAGAGQRRVELQVEDNRASFDPELAARVFAPLAGGEPRAGAYRIGLAVCGNVVAAHGGHIEVDRSAAGGACFRVLLPRSGVTDLDEERSTAPVSGGPPRRRRVFLVDDDPMFARAMRRALRPHDVQTASTAGEAQIALLDPGYQPDLVVCDVLLPGANGNVLHARVKSERPEVAKRFVFVTGGGLGKSEADYLRDSGCITLRKPLDAASLLALLGESPIDPPPAVRTLARSDAGGRPAS